MSIQIGKLLANGTVRHIKVTNEELSERFIRVLKRFYPNEERVDALIALGDIHRLGPSPYGKWTDCRDEIHCFGAIRDGRRDNTHLPRIADSVELFKSYVEDYFIKPVKNTIRHLTVYHNANAGFAMVHNLTRWEEIEEFAEREKVILYVYKYFRLVKIVKPSRLKEEKYV